MNEITLQLNQNNQGAFVIINNDEVLAEVRIAITHNYLIAYHTEVSDKLKGQGIGKKLFDHLVTYARQNQQKVIALCPFINASFSRHPELYTDVWQQDYKGITL